MAKIATFDEWVDLFRAWQREIGLDPSVFGDYQWETKFGALDTPEIKFGRYAGQPRWQSVLEVPDERAQEMLFKLVKYQGDTEFASVEQQRRLVQTAPSPYDRYSIARIMREEMRHGWQMCYLLVEHFGDEGKAEAQRQLERRAFNKERLLNAFNFEVDNWLDFFVYTEFQDRDGKFQLKMLSHSAFEPLARSVVEMLREESFHLGTGHTGLKRIVRAGKIPVDVLQRYFNKWVPACYDLFGRDHSTSAQYAYEWGLKGRFEERQGQPAADLGRLNEAARGEYRAECAKLVEQLNRLLPAEGPRLRLPDVRFNRGIGDYAGKPYTVEGEPVPADAYPAYLAAHLPTAADKALVERVAAEGDWIAPHGSVK